MSTSLLHSLFISLSVLSWTSGFSSFPQKSPFDFWRQTSMRSSNPYDSHDFFTPLMTPYSMFNGPLDMVRRQSRQQAVMMAERLLSKDIDVCMQREFCKFGTYREEEATDETEAARNTIEMMQTMLNEFGDDNVQKFPHIRQLVASFGVGRQTEDMQMCKWLFPCQTPIEATSVVSGRSTCKAASKVCPGIAITCGLCSILSPQTCSAVCPVTAIYCGTSGYVCAPSPEKSTTPAPSPPTTTPSTTAAPSNDPPRSGIDENRFGMDTDFTPTRSSSDRFGGVQIKPRNLKADAQMEPETLLKVPRYADWF
ncbi:hypothetical protein TCAL_12051 [Tigriopus californicus]|uniref:Uncharacterized protein n=1 Tax=Tigriopus californicus TaxID=6832 RepID=A0A553PLE6_TIGCA|nr:hypothetical protein TCAL_12051 [Tigriopus californicus]|eukprot:TCALIF_12051-PA protein Name:"Protein of unknown function" AED:0.00 eAED:0.00 QI:78/1/1/1/1/1/4/111/309